MTHFLANTAFYVTADDWGLNVFSVYRPAYACTASFRGSRESPDFCRICLSLRGNDAGFAGGFEFEGAIGQLLNDLDVRVFGEPVVTARLEELLLHGDAARRIDPEDNARDIVAQLSGLWNQFEFRCLRSVHCLRTQILHVIRLEQILSAAAESEHQETFEITATLAGIIFRDLVDFWLIDLHFAATVQDIFLFRFQDVGGHLRLAT